jgi:hypothetical protein
MGMKVAFENPVIIIVDVQKVLDDSKQDKIKKSSFVYF